MTSYAEFLERKAQLGGNHGFAPIWMPKDAFAFQSHVIDWNCRKGKSADFMDCGLGKTLIQLAWAENVVRQTAKPVLILTPLAVSHQTVAEAAKFGMDAQRCADGKHDGTSRILVTNYERLHYFNADDFAGCVCDESSILKNFDGVFKSAITDFMRKMPYRLLCTATAAPNDYIELGTSSEALGDLGYIDMLKTFFKSSDGSYAQGGGNGARRFSTNPFGGKFRFRGHAEMDFWRWVCSWSRSARKPSDLGFDDADFALPPIEYVQHVVNARKKNTEFLFDMPAVGLSEQRDERRRSLKERCEMANACVMVNGGPSILWCALNDEGDLLEEIVEDSIQVKGSDSDGKKEESFRAFEALQVKRIITKGSIAGWGLNWQHCAHQTHFPNNSFEQYYQCVRRSWRFGQKNPVRIDIVTSEGQSRELQNLQRKAAAAETMFSRLVEMMSSAQGITRTNPFTKKEKLPKWLSPTKR